MSERALSEEELQKLWYEYKQKKSIPLRNKLVEHFLPLVKHIAEKLKERLHPCIQLDDLVSAGVFGLIDAIQKFDISRGVKFESYAYERIRGSMLDELRRIDWAPRLLRARQNQYERAYYKLEKELNRPPTDQELAREMKISVKELQELYQEISMSASILSLHQTFSDSDDDTISELQIVEDKKAMKPAEESIRKDLTQYITKYLPEKERKILMMYYYDDLTLKEIGTVLGLSESRVCQIHSRTLSKLRSILKRKKQELMED
jgi:RNA polymerase sigma factor for flagellar operon FliA